jgi:putative membrane protein
MITLTLLLTLFLYTRGVVTLWTRRGRGHGVRGWQVAAFFMGVLTTWAALSPTLEAYSEQYFAAHMIQHMLLIAVAAPLIAVSRPIVPLLHGLPIMGRRAFRGNARWFHILQDWRVVWLLHAGAIWFWHIPGAYGAALNNGAIHLLEHATFFGTALLFWWQLQTVRSIQQVWIGAFAAFTMGLQGGLLGALLFFSRGAWYAEHAARASGLTPLEDQQIAALVMWIPAGLVYTGAALRLVWLALQDQPEQRSVKGA